MLQQIQLNGKTKLETTLDRIRMFEPEEGYYLAFSGGKDSQCIYELAKMAGVKFDAHYSVTSVDPPELVQFIKKNYPDVIFEIPHDKNGKPVTMWTLIRENAMPPTRIIRYCCRVLKESSGKGRVTMTGVRWAESTNRKRNQGLVTIMPTGKKKQNETEDIGSNLTRTDRGGAVLNEDNDETRRSVEICYRTNKTLVNPIIDWDDSEVWEFLNDVAQVPHCCLYDEGFKRLGCIGCPMQGAKRMIRDFDRWPKYKEAYIRSLQKMNDIHPFQLSDPEKYMPKESNSKYKEGEAIFNWWIDN